MSRLTSDECDSRQLPPLSGFHKGIARKYTLHSIMPDGIFLRGRVLLCGAANNATLPVYCLFVMGGASEWCLCPVSLIDSKRKNGERTETCNVQRRSGWRVDMEIHASGVSERQAVESERARRSVRLSQPVMAHQAHHDVSNDRMEPTARRCFLNFAYV